MTGARHRGRPGTTPANTMRRLRDESLGTRGVAAGRDGQDPGRRSRHLATSPVPQRVRERPSAGKPVPSGAAGPAAFHTGFTPEFDPDFDPDFDPIGR